MQTNPTSESPLATPKRKNTKLRWVLAILAIWAVVAYLMIPFVSKKYFQHHSITETSPRITRTADEHPGDPLNLSIVGSEEEIIRAMTAVGWFPADPITFDTSVRIAVDSVFRKPDENAPVSNLFLFGRKQDLALEQPIGNNPRQRHHVRFWRCEALQNGRATWLASATLDDRVGLSYANGQITHHIGPDIDTERDRIMTELKAAGWVSDEHYMDGFQQPPEGRNGGGDLWKTDGRLGVVVLQSPTP